MRKWANMTFKYQTHTFLCHYILHFTFDDCFFIRIRHSCVSFCACVSVSCSIPTYIFQMLIDFGADINSIYRLPGNIVQTPLDCALNKGHRSTAKFLQLHGGLPANKLRLSGRNPNALNDQELVKPLPLTFGQKQHQQQQPQQRPNANEQPKKTRSVWLYLDQSDSEMGKLPHESCSIASILLVWISSSFFLSLLKIRCQKQSIMQIIKNHLHLRSRNRANHAVVIIITIIIIGIVAVFAATAVNVSKFYNAIVVRTVQFVDRKVM